MMVLSAAETQYGRLRMGLASPVLIRWGTTDGCPRGRLFKSKIYTDTMTAGDEELFCVPQEGQGQSSYKCCP